MIGPKRCLRWYIAGLALLFSGVAASAQAPAPQRMARLTSVEGYVHVDRADNLAEVTAGDPAQLNMPLLEGQTVVTGDNGQAEVEFEDGSLARVTPNSALALARLGMDGSGGFTTQLLLAKGLAYFELRAAPRLAYTVAAAADRITPLENTTFRINLDEAPASIAVFDGSAHVERAGGYQADLRAGESLRGDDAAPGRYVLTEQIVPDSWDQWNESRDQMAADAASQNTAARDNYAGTQGYGWSDLDANGRWYDVAGQGEVWQPNGGDAESFDPYGQGSWAWYPGAGYVWASSYAWGWTPFRCGGWSYWSSFGWGWTPNSACGGFGLAGYGGYGFGGYGYFGGYGGNGTFRGPFNIILPPLQYKGHRPPPPIHGPHPIVAVHEGGSLGVHPQPSGLQAPAPKMIAGHMATPLNPSGPSYTLRGGSAVGSSLRRDFPVDRTTHTAILGVQPGQGISRGFVSGGQQVRAPYYGPQSPGARTGGYALPGGGYTVPGASPRSTLQNSPHVQSSPGIQGSRPAQSYTPHSSAPAPVSAPHPSFSAPSAPHASAPSGGGSRK